METNHQLLRSTSSFLENIDRYRRLVGRLLYLFFTRLDLTNVVHVLSQFLHAPRRDHWDATVRIDRYLKGCPGQGILLHS